VLPSLQLLILQILASRQGCGRELQLQARVYRNMDGLDMTLYEKVLKVRADFLAAEAAAPMSDD
jgi:Telomere-capping, CST complex subunit